MATSSSAPTRGRPVDPNSTSGKIRALLGTGMALGDIAKKLGCPPTLVYAVKAREAGGGKAKKKKRPPKAKAASTGTMDNLSSILDMVKRNEAERTRLLGALEKVAAAVREALAQAPASVTVDGVVVLPLEREQSIRRLREAVRAMHCEVEAVSA